MIPTKPRIFPLPIFSSSCCCFRLFQIPNIPVEPVAVEDGDNDDAASYRQGTEGWYVTIGGGLCLDDPEVGGAGCPCISPVATLAVLVAVAVMVVVSMIQEALYVVPPSSAPYSPPVAAASEPEPEPAPATVWAVAPPARPQTHPPHHLYHHCRHCQHCHHSRHHCHHNCSPSSRPLPQLPPQPYLLHSPSSPSSPSQTARAAPDTASRHHYPAVMPIVHMPFVPDVG
mmetsp:Transcript_30502/g.67626  ORF Transcript_30502/g.67626 Transcript_30502/m.67626 type:complete len:228 (-) Transcript_30502:205-888(-)